jgi:hypothetical protein
MIFFSFSAISTSITDETTMTHDSDWLLRDENKEKN